MESTTVDQEPTPNTTEEESETVTEESTPPTEDTTDPTDSTDPTEAVEDEEDDDESSEETPEEKDREIAMLREHEEEVRLAADEVTNRKSEHERAKDIASAKKKELDAAVEELRQIASQRPSFGELFDKREDDDDEQEADPHEAGPDAWKQVDVGVLSEHGVTSHIIGKLRVALKPPTLGELSLQMEQGGDTWHQDVEGVGSTTAESIGDGMQKWFAANPDLCQSAEDDAGGTDEDPQLSLVGGDEEDEDEESDGED